MLIYLYRFLINIVFILSPIIIIIRLIKKKENFKRFKEKFCFFSHRKKQKKLIWFHGASVGELLSVIPLIKELEKDKKVDQILVTTTTLSSSKVFNNFKFKKTIHQFFPIDTNFLCPLEIASLNILIVNCIRSSKGAGPLARPRGVLL